VKGRIKMIRWFCEYVKQCKCSHNFEVDERPLIVNPHGFGCKEGIKVSMLCSKCGYHKVFWKHGSTPALAVGVKGQYMQPTEFMNKSLLNKPQL